MLSWGEFFLSTLLLFCAGPIFKFAVYIGVYVRPVQILLTFASLALGEFFKIMLGALNFLHLGFNTRCKDRPDRVRDS